MNELIKEIKKLYKLEPYSFERYEQLGKIKKLESESKVIHYPNNPNIKEKTIKIEIIRKDKNGLFEKIIEFKIKNIKVEG